MSKIVVIYKTKYGTTKQYAEWIAETLDAPLFEASSVKPAQLMDYDTVVYGGGLYAGGILGVNLVVKNPCKSLVLFTVGLGDPAITDFSPILTKTFAPEVLPSVKVFHLRGGMDYAKLSLIHKGLMAVLKKSVEKKPPAERSADDPEFLETYGKKIDYTDKSTIMPLVEYVRAL